MPQLKLVPFQRQVVLCAARFMCLMAGRRAGKSEAIKARMKLKTTQHPKFRYLYCTPLSGQALEVYNELVADRDFRKFIRSFRERPYPRINLKNGSRVWFRSLQRPEGLRSTGEDEICVDESQDEKITESDINTIIKPMLADRIGPHGQRGTLLLAGQFRGSDFRFLNYWLPGMDLIDGAPNLKCRRPMFHAWQVPSSEGYAFRTPGGPEELELQKSNCSISEWEQEWECKPRANKNAVFNSFEVDEISTGREPRIAIELKAPYGAGGVYGTVVDVGGTVDQTKIIVGHSSGKIVFAKALPLGMHDKASAREVMEVARRYGRTVIVDSTGGGDGRNSTAQDSRMNAYRNEARLFHLQFKEFFWSHKNKERLISNLRVAVQEKTIGIAADLVDVITELKTYEYKYLPRTHTYHYGAPAGKADDYVQAVAIFVEALNQSWIRVGSSALLSDFIG